MFKIVQTSFLLLLFCTYTFAGLGRWKGTYINVTNLFQIVNEGKLAKTQNATVMLSENYLTFRGYYESHSVPISGETSDDSSLRLTVYDNGYYGDGNDGDENGSIYAYKSFGRPRGFYYNDDRYVKIDDFWGVDLKEDNLYNLTIALFFSRGYWHQGKPFAVEALINKQKSSIEWELHKDGKVVPFEGGRATDFCDEGYIILDKQQHIFSPTKKSVSLHPVTSIGVCDYDTIGTSIRLKSGKPQYESSGGILYSYPGGSQRWGSVRRGERLFVVAKTDSVERYGARIGRWFFVLTPNKFGWIHESAVEEYYSSHKRDLFKTNNLNVSISKYNRGVYVDNPLTITRPLPPKYPDAVLRTEVECIDFDKDYEYGNGGTVDPIFIYYYKDSIEIAPLLMLQEQTDSILNKTVFKPQPKAIIRGTEIRTLAVNSWHPTEKWCNIHFRSYLDSTKLKLSSDQKVTTRDAYTVILGGGADPQKAHSCLAQYLLNPVSLKVRQQEYPKMVLSDTIAGLNPGYLITLAGLYESRSAADSCAARINEAVSGAYVRKIHLPKKKEEPYVFSILDFILSKAGE